MKLTITKQVSYRNECPQCGDCYYSDEPPEEGTECPKCSIIKSSDFEPVDINESGYVMVGRIYSGKPEILKYYEEKLIGKNYDLFVKEKQDGN